MIVKTAFILLLSLVLHSCGEESEDQVGQASSAIDRDYNNADFQAAVDREVKRTLKRAGQENLIELTQELMNREREIKKQELSLKKKKEELAASQRDFSSQLVEFRQQQERFIGCLDQQQDEMDRRVSHMVNVISGMRPQNAADVLAVQDIDLAVMILEKLNPDNVARIFNQMDKEISARLQKKYLNMTK